jgi:hypothetical protein
MPLLPKATRLRFDDNLLIVIYQSHQSLGKTWISQQNPYIHGLESKIFILIAVE